MVPEEKRLSIEMGAERFRIDVQKTGRYKRPAGAKAARG